MAQANTTPGENWRRLVQERLNSLQRGLTVDDVAYEVEFQSGRCYQIWSDMLVPRVLLFIK